MAQRLISRRFQLQRFQLQRFQLQRFQLQRFQLQRFQLQAVAFKRLDKLLTIHLAQGAIFPCFSKPNQIYLRRVNDEF